MPTPRKPNPLRALHGEPTVTPPNFGPLAEAPKPPSWLPRPAKAEWRRIVSSLKAYPTWLQQTDRAALTAYCMAWHTFEEAAKDVAARGPLVPGRSSADQAREGPPALVKNPSVQVMRDAGAALRQWSVQLGFTPEARAKVDVGDLETDLDPDSPFDVELRGGRRPRQAGPGAYLA